MQKKDRSIYSKYVLNHIKEHLLALLFMCGSSCVGLLIPIVNLKIFDNVIPQKNISLLIKLIILELVLYFLQGLTKYIANIIYIKLGNNINLELKEKLLNKIAKLSGDFFSTKKTGDLITLILEDVNAFESLMVNSLATLLSDIIIYIPICCYVLYLQPILFICLLIIHPLLWFINRKMTNRIYGESRNYKKTVTYSNSKIEEFLSSLLEFVLANSSNYHLHKIKKSLDEVKKSSNTLESTIERRNTTMEMLTALTTIVIIGVGGFCVVFDKMSIGGLMVFLQYSGRIFQPILSVNEFVSQYKKTKVSLERIDKILNADEIESGIVRLDSLKNGDIEFHDVTFEYDKGKEVLHRLNLKIQRNKINVIVGESGSGKSTLISLLLRMWKPKNGLITIGGVNINDFDLQTYRVCISVVSQNSALFNGSIKENILLNKVVSDEKLEDICQTAGIAEFIHSLPNGVETIIGDKGMCLSGGQRQRIEIARALAQDTSIIVFDEATSALDAVTEKKIINEVFMKINNKTVIIITHKFTVIDAADIIYVLDNGRIVEYGSSRELLKKKGKYFQLYSESKIFSEIST